MLDTNHPDSGAKPPITVVAALPKNMATDALIAQAEAMDNGASYKADKTVAFKSAKPSLRTQMGNAILHMKKRFAEEKFIFGFDKEKQDKFIFNPRPENLRPLKSPLDYQELEPYAVSERTIVTDRSVFGAAKASITLWEKKADAGKPHVFYFTGRSGHIADTGALVIPPGTAAKDLSLYEGYEREAGLKFLAELAKNGAGFTVVTMSGYGNNKGVPGEDAFKRDIKALVADWKKTKDHPPASEMVVSGYSLGTASAAIMAEEMARIGEPPAMLCLANGFSSMIRRGKEFLDIFLKDPEDPKLKPYKGLDFSEETIKNRMLKHPLNTSERIQALPPETTICLAYSSNDELVGNTHSKRLLGQIMDAHPYIEQVYEGCGHINVPPELIARNLLQAYDFVKSPQGQKNIEDVKIDTMKYRRDGEYLPQKSITLRGRSWSEIAEERAAKEAVLHPPHPAHSIGR